MQIMFGTRTQDEAIDWVTAIRQALEHTKGPRSEGVVSVHYRSKPATPAVSAATNEVDMDQYTAALVQEVQVCLCVCVRSKEPWRSGLTSWIDGLVVVVVVVVAVAATVSARVACADA
jgi:hypothetical protein